MQPQQRLSNTQLEILKAFSHQLNTQDLIDFRETIATFFAKKAIQLADKKWDEMGWTDADVDDMLSTKMRKPNS